MSRSKKVFVARLIPDSVYQRTSGPLWQPAADIYRCPQGYKIKFDLAGVKPEDLEVLVGENRIIVRGVRRDSVLTQGWSYQQLEITYSRFERVLQIPCDLSKAEIRVESIEGWLLVHIDYAAQMLAEGGESPEK